MTTRDLKSNIDVQTSLGPNDYTASVCSLMARLGP